MSGLYEEVISAGGGGLVAPRAPRPSASVVLWRRAGSRAGSRVGSEIELFWLKRGAELPFMGGWHAFPGGAVDRADAAVELHGAPGGAAPGGWTQASASRDDSPAEPDLVPGVAAAALRELHEESGVRLAADGRLDASRLLFAGRWLTPPFAPVRFDNRFFLAEWRPEDGEPRAVPPESESGEWIRPVAALARIRRGEALAAPPILHLLSGLAEGAPDDPATPARLRDSSSANLGPLRRIELRRGILLLPLASPTLPPATHTNAYILGTGESVLVDPGAVDAAENGRLVEAISELEAKHGRKLTAIWLTHHHPDHVGGVEFVRRALDLPVFAHAATAERLAGRIAVDGELTDGQRVVLAGAGAGAGAGEPFAIRVIHTPGHARGHLAFEVEATRDLVAGDMVAGFGTIVIDPPEGDMSDYLESLEKLRAREPRTLFVAHGAPFLDAGAKLDEALRHRLAREEQVLHLVREGRRDPAEMVPEIYPDVPAAIRPLAARQVRAHLLRLERSGTIRA